MRMLRCQQVPIRIMNLHQGGGSSGGGVRSKFLCHMLPNVPRACQTSLEEDRQEPEQFKNAKISLVYDALAVEAATRDMFNTTFYQRHDMAIQIQEHHKNVLGRTAAKLSQICPTKTELLPLFTAARQKEADIWPLAISETVHQESFDKHVQAGM